MLSAPIGILPRNEAGGIPWIYGDEKARSGTVPFQTGLIPSIFLTPEVLHSSLEVGFTFPLKIHAQSLTPARVFKDNHQNTELLFIVTSSHEIKTLPKTLPEFSHETQQVSGRKLRRIWFLSHYFCASSGMTTSKHTLGRSRLKAPQNKTGSSMGCPKVTRNAARSLHCC